MNVEHEAVRARNITPARIITLTIFAALAALSSRTHPLFWVLLALCTGWVLLTRRAGGATLPVSPVVVGDSIFVLAALASTGQEQSDLRWAVVALPVAWATLYASRSILAAGPIALLACLTVMSTAFTEDIWRTETFVFVVAFLGAATLAYANARESEGVRARADALERNREALLELALSAEERERGRLSEVLHDESLQYLLSAGQDLNELEVAAAQAETLSRARESLAHGLRTLRSTVRTMHPLTVYHGDLDAMLQELAQTHGRRGGFTTTLDVAPASMGEADELVVSLVRELLTNAAKHARASHVDVHVSGGRDDGELTVRVADDGVGIPPQRPELARAAGHIGLALAQDRIRTNGGVWTMRSAPGAGVQVTVKLPLRDPDGSPD